MKRSAQDVFIFTLEKSSALIKSVAQECINDLWEKISLERAIQLISCVLFQECFGLNMSNLSTVLNSPYLQYIHNYISELTGSFPGGSSLIRRIPQITSFIPKKIQNLVQDIQDTYYCELGDRAREAYKKQIMGSRRSVSAPFECFRIPLGLCLLGMIRNVISGRRIMQGFRPKDIFKGHEWKKKDQIKGKSFIIESEGVCGKCGSPLKNGNCNCED